MNKFSCVELDEKRLAEQTLDYILNNQNTCLGSSLFIKILDPRIKYGDLNNHVEFLKERLSHVEFFIDYDTVEFKNKMKTYQVLETDEFGRVFDNSGILAPLSFEKENFSKEIFWESKKEKESYHDISNFICFKEKVVPQEKLYATLLKPDIFNIDGWIQYYQDLLDLKFPEFCEKLISDKKVIKYRFFKDDYYLGIETDYKLNKSNFKKGIWLDPDYKLIIFKKLDKKNIDRVVIFNKFFHPHFDPPVYSFEWFFYAKNTIHVSEFGEELKRHAYFYYDMLYHTTKEFIKFVEESFDPEE